MFSRENFNQPQPSILQEVLEPLLDDFRYWFSETKDLLNSPKADCLPFDERQHLLDEINISQEQVTTAKTLLLATNGNAGVDTALVAQWHQLVNKCWQTSRRIREMNQNG